MQLNFSKRVEVQCSYTHPENLWGDGYVNSVEGPFSKVYIYQIRMLYTLSILQFCQIYFSKAKVGEGVITPFSPCHGLAAPVDLVMEGRGHPSSFTWVCPLSPWVPSRFIEVLSTRRKPREKRVITLVDVTFLMAAITSVLLIFFHGTVVHWSPTLW